MLERIRVDFPAAKMIAIQDSDLFEFITDDCALFMMKDSAPDLVISDVATQIWNVQLINGG